MQTRDQPAPVILHKLCTSTQTASDGVDDFVLKSRQRFARRIESVGSITVRIRRPAKYRLGVHADRTEKEVNEEPGWPQHVGISNSQAVYSSIRLHRAPHWHFLQACAPSSHKWTRGVPVVHHLRTAYPVRVVELRCEFDRRVATRYNGDFMTAPSIETLRQASGIVSLAVSAGGLRWIFPS